MIRFRSVGLALVFFLMLPLFCYSQESNLGNWLIYIGNKKIDTKWDWHHEVQYRNYNAIGDLEQLLLRTGIGHNLTENNNNLLLGYGFIRSENYAAGTDAKVVVNEHRIFQQFITKHNLSRLSLQHRFRFEQRFVEETDLRLRVRYFLGLGLPLSNKEVLDKTFYLSAYSELFLNTKKDFFDRNRLYGGIGYRFNSTVRMELGYMNQFLSNGSRDQINLLVFTNFGAKKG